MKSVHIALCAILMAGAPAIAKDKPQTGQEKLAEATKGLVAGTPVDCISLNAVRSSRIIDKTAIIYDAGQTLYVNIPASGAAFLDRDDILVTNTSSTRLCSIDVVRLVDPSTRASTGSVGLGKFVPYTKPRG